MAGVKYGSIRKEDPRWAQDQLDRHSLIQGGGFLEETEFTLPNTDGLNVVYNGTLVGRTWAEKESGVGYGPADVAADEQIYILVHDVDFDDHEIGADGQCTLYRHNSQVREEKLPNWATLTAAEKTWIRTNYEIV